MKRDEGIVELKRLSDWEIEIVDPNNNLHVTIGSSMGSFNKMWEGLIVDYVNENNIIKLHEGKMVKAVVNNKDELRWYGAKSDGYKVYDSVEQFLKELKSMTNNKQQTAVEWFWNQLPEILPFTVDTATAVKLQEAYQQAKEMEKEQIIIAWVGGKGFLNGEQYYNETYGGNK